MMSSVTVTFDRALETTDSSRPRVAVSTLGCKVNLYESNLIAQRLKTQNWRQVSARQHAEMHIINTCTVTQEADRQARQEVRRVIRKNPDAFVIVTGCYAQMDPVACAAIPGVDLVVGNDRKLDIHKLLPLYQTGKLPRVVVGDLDQHVSLPDGLLTGIDGQTRAFIQVQQGCNQGCTFCIIHRARGPSRSIDMPVIRRQAERLVMNGYRELVICGVDLGSYGQDLDHSDYDLVDLIDELHQNHEGIRLRLSSIDPAHISDRLINRFKDRVVCPHLHLSLQSASTLILKRMKRRYDKSLVYERIERLRSAVSDLVISADVMTGFPTETDEHFNETLKAIGDLEIAYPHVFPYSARSGTPASRIPRQIEVQTRKARAEQIRQAGINVLSSVLARNSGHRHRVLTEASVDKKTGMRRARSENYLPIWVPAHIEANKLVNVVARPLNQHSLIALGHPKTLN